MMAEPYPIKDSNRLIEEYMLCANYLVAEYMIMNCGNLGVLRRHPEPVDKGLADVIELANACNVHIDASSSEKLQESLNRFGREVSKPTRRDLLCGGGSCGGGARTARWVLCVCVCIQKSCCETRLV